MGTLYSDIDPFCCEVLRARIVACVNAMADIPDPDAFVERANRIEKAAADVLAWFGDGSNNPIHPNDLRELRTALALCKWGGGDTQPEEREPNQNKPIGTCPKCHTPVYTNEGFCGVCRPH